MKLKFILLGMLLSLAVLAACGSAKTTFPTGKFIKDDTREYGLQFNADGTVLVFNG